MSWSNIFWMVNITETRISVYREWIWVINKYKQQLRNIKFNDITCVRQHNEGIIIILSQLRKAKLAYAKQKSV